MKFELQLPNGTTVDSFSKAADAGYPVACEWFRDCTDVATHVEPHPVLTGVPTCDRCAQVR